MKKALLLGSAVTLMLGGAPVVALADDAVPTNAPPVQLAQDQTTPGVIDAGSLIGQEVYGANGETVGDVESVMVAENGEVRSVIVDVSGWLESEKLISLNWSDVQIGQDQRITTSMTKEAAESAAAYDYKDPSLRGQVMTETGERYAETPRPVGGETDQTTTADTTADPADTAATTGTDADVAATAPATGDTDAADSAVMNADGSLNASKLIGLDVQSAEDEKVGDIGEVVLDQEGQVQGVVVDVGGFLGIGSRPVLLDWEEVNLASEDGEDRAVVNLNRERLEQMPVYESSSR